MSIAPICIIATSVWLLYVNGIISSVIFFSLETILHDEVDSQNTLYVIPADKEAEAK